VSSELSKLLVSMAFVESCESAPLGSPQPMEGEIGQDILLNSAIVLATSFAFVRESSRCGEVRVAGVTVAPSVV